MLNSCWVMLKLQLTQKQQFVAVGQVVAQMQVSFAKVAVKWRTAPRLFLSTEKSLCDHILSSAVALTPPQAFMPRFVPHQQQLQPSSVQR